MNAQQGQSYVHNVAQADSVLRGRGFHFVKLERQWETMVAEHGRSEHPTRPRNLWTCWHQSASHVSHWHTLVEVRVSGQAGGRRRWKEEVGTRNVVRRRVEACVGRIVTEHLLEEEVDRGDLEVACKLRSS